MAEKQTLRQQAKALRKTQDMAAISQQIRENVAGWPIFQAAKTVGLFMQLVDEINLVPLMATFPQKQWALPRTLPDAQLVFHLYTPGDTLESGPFGLQEPAKGSPTLNVAEIDLLFVPALMLDGYGHRLGYGKGYYDQLLAACLNRQPVTVCPIPNVLFTASLPADPWDVPVQWCVTEEKIFQLGSNEKA